MQSSLRTVCVLLIAGLLCLHHASAINLLLRDGPKVKKVSAPPSTYKGAGDVAPFSTWWGMRAFEASTRGSRLISLCEPTGVTCQDVNSDATTGFIDSPPTIAGTNCATVATCIIHEFYGRAGQSACSASAGCDLGNPAGNVLLTPNCLNGHACANCNTASLTTTGANWTVTSPQPISMSFAAARTGLPTDYGIVLISDFTLANPIQTGFWDIAGQVFTGAGTNVPQNVYTEGAYTAVQSVANGASSLMNIDNMPTIGPVNMGATGTSSSVAPGICGNGYAGSQITFLEAGFYLGGFTVNQMAALSTNQHSQWGF